MKAPPRYVIGVDGGGTKTVAVVGGRDGAVLVRGIGGPCSISSMTPSDAFDSVRSACQGALHDAGLSVGDVAAVCAGVAGWSVERHRAQFSSLLAAYFHAAIISVLPDYAIALAGATAGQPGIVVIAGTGSIAYGENASGESMRTGGYGYLIDDAGSAYGVGREAIAAVLKAEEGLEEPIALRDPLLRICGVESPADLGPAVYDGRLSRTGVAALAAAVVDAANAGDAVAVRILQRAGSSLADLAAPIARRLFPNDPATIVPIGGLWNAGPALRDPFKQRLDVVAPSLHVGAAIHPPEEGAVLKALAL